MTREWLYALLPAVAAALLIEIARRTALARRLEDHPNERSLHVAPTPRVGGLGLVPAALSFAAAVATPPLAAILAAAFFIALVSFADDLRSLPVAVRLPAHFSAAAVAVLALGGSPGVGWSEAIAAVIAIAWMTNLYNFMDGSDGLAGGMAVVGFGALALAAGASGDTALALAATAIASASAGFLFHNFPPARVFLGDSGSVCLGFLAGALGVLGVAASSWPAWFPLLVFSPFIVDATFTLARRLWRREKVWKAHRSHAYQRLVLSGWSRRRLALWAYALMLASAASALAALRSGPEGRSAILVAWLAIYFLLLVAVERRTKAQAA